MFNLVSWLTGHHAASGHGFKQLLDLWCTVNKLVRPKLEGVVLDQLNEGDEETPGMRSVDNQSLQQHSANIKCRILNLSLQVFFKPGNLFLDCFCVGLGKQIEQDR